MATSTDEVIKVPAQHKNAHPSIFMFLYLPFGIFSGFTTVTLGFLLSNAGVSTAEIAAVVAVPILPNIFKFLWAPLVDTTLTAKRWYHLSNFATALGIVLITMVPFTGKALSLLIFLTLLVSLANTFIPMAAENLIARDVPDEVKGRAGGWMQVGNLGGNGVGGGAGIWLAENLYNLHLAGVIIALCCLVCSLWLFKLSDPVRQKREEPYFRTVTTLGKSVWDLVKSRDGFLSLILCLLPIASGAASSLWSSVHEDWHASAEVVELVVGVLGGVMAALGCLAGGWICDRMDRKKAYLLFGLLEAACALLMILSPRTEFVFILGTSFYAITSGLGYAAFSAFVLEAIGATGAATKYNIFSGVSNLPIYLMVMVDGFAHQKWGAKGLLAAEIVMPVLGMVCFVIVAHLANKKVINRSHA